MEVTFSEAKKPEAPKPINFRPPTVIVDPPLEAHEPRVTPTPAEVKEETKDLYKSMEWGEPPAGTVGEPPQAQPTEEVPKPEETVPPATPEPEPEAEPQSEPTTQQIATETAREVGREIARELRQDRPAPHTEPPAPKLDLSPEDTADLEVIRYLEREEPRFKGATQRYLDYVKSHYDYQVEWMKANPGKEFDPDEVVEKDGESSRTHDQWYADNDPGISRDEIDQGRIQKLAEEVADKKYGAKLREIEQNEKLGRALPRIAAAQTSRVHEMVTMVSPELAKLVTGTNGAPNLTEATAAAVYEADPIAAPIIDKIAAEELNPMIEELGKVDTEGLNYKFDARNNPVHKQIANFILDKEREMAKAPRSVQVVNGAQWIPLADYNRRIGEIDSASGNEYERRGRIDELNRTYWALSTDMTASLITDYCAQKAKRLIDAEDKRAKKKYGRTETPAAETVKETPVRTSALPPNPHVKPRSPSLGGQSEIATTTKVGAGSAKSYGDTAVDVNFAR